MRLRLRLFEFEDLPWFPTVIRAGMMDYLRFMISTLGTYRPIAPLLAEGLRRTGQTALLELGAGAGGGTETVWRALQAEGLADVTVTLTDLYPQPAAWADIAQRTQGRIGHEPAPVNALAVPAQLAGFRVIFSAFHHFPPTAAQALLHDAVRAGTGIGVFEGAGKHWAELLLAWTVLPVAQLLLTPFSGRFASAAWCLRTSSRSYRSAPFGMARSRCCACTRPRSYWRWPNKPTPPSNSPGKPVKNVTGGARRSLT
ncbi:hypothetical protein ACFQT0_10665 [Hymenobacter humi]|uniref:Class I SAM-dependent methyltransferase n=1 Tax=Hymenobacter humi TaxID=1411620 RepID=A0ABW2U6V7_9BACT